MGHGASGYRAVLPNWTPSARETSSCGRALTIPLRAATDKTADSMADIIELSIAQKILEVFTRGNCCRCCCRYPQFCSRQVMACREVPLSLPYIKEPTNPRLPIDMARSPEHDAPPCQFDCVPHIDESRARRQIPSFDPFGALGRSHAALCGFHDTDLRIVVQISFQRPFLCHSSDLTP